MDSIRAAADLANPALYQSGPPHEALRELRRSRPVFWHEAQSGPGFWAVLSHREATTVLRDATHFSSRLGPALVDPPASMRDHFEAMLPYQDPPRHRLTRRAVLPAFQSRWTRWLETRVREHTVASIAEAVARGRADFALELAAEMPLRVLCELLGTPPEERHWLREWTDLVTEGVRRGSVELGAYLADHLRGRRAGGEREDLISLVLAAFSGASSPTHPRLGDDQLAGILAQIVQGGQETVRNLLSGSLLALVTHPAVWETLANTPKKIPAAVEEMLRFVSPVQHLRRTVAEEVSLGGQMLAEGDRVVVFLLAANRDESSFATPDDFVADRRPNPHLSLGLGEHVCIGARIARIEARIFWEEFLRQVNSVELEGPIERLRSAQQAGIRSLPVAIRAR